MKRYRMLLGVVLVSIVAFLLSQTSPGIAGKPVPTSSQKEVFSQLVEATGTGNVDDTITYSILTVPAGKTAVVTDIRVSRYVGANTYLSVLEDGTTKFRSNFDDHWNTIQEFSTGVVVGSGSELSILVEYFNLDSNPSAHFMDLFVAGYLVDAAF